MAWISSDPDGDNLSHRWYFYPEAGTYRGKLPAIVGTSTPHCFFRVPDDGNGSLHLILEVEDNSKTVTLTDYRRVVIQSSGK
jgi:hypothetical protein